MAVFGQVKEPYCSEVCKEKAATTLAFAKATKDRGPCTFCQTTVAYEVGSQALMFPYRNQKAFLCPRCVTQAHAFMAQVRECCLCGEPLSTVGASASKCFIATAACGSDQAADVARLRQFRDVVLRCTAVGRGFISLYEATSPPVARLISRSSSMRFMARAVVVGPARRMADLVLRVRENSSHKVAPKEGDSTTSSCEPDAHMGAADFEGT